MIAFLHLTVAILLGVSGFSISAQPKASYPHLLAATQHPVQEWVQTDNALTGKGSHQIPDLPEELPANEEEREETVDETEREKTEFDEESLLLHLLAYKLALSHTSAHDIFYLNTSPVQVITPLYVLFHCWKTYLL